MQVTDDAGIQRITFDRPDALNAFTTDAAAELADVLSGADPTEFDAIVLTGAGRAFSAGGDVESMATREETPEEAYERIDETFGRLAEEALSCRVPIVAQVNGDAVGAGMAIVALTDFAYAVESARFSAAFVRVGLIPDTGGTFLLPRLVGLRAAKDLAFTGRFFDAGEAADLGLVNGVVGEDQLDDRIDDLLDTLRERPTRTIGLAKRTIHANLGRGFEEALDYENVVQSQAYGTQEHGEGVDAFLADRDPEFHS
ncbi:enoyl-CoA hydratase/isomerase family protein [Halalkalicoccus jeotgali]|uniref:Enoyl-CoA hydratase/isomerase n=1 Tax=Halalkalicoccus jeotgali (strain DSM 18796 / CECT 7217 / JCM 14584 / KCTC 4019 / B3) TaxID=795797 RepID=D8J2I4_HALJB|nr:enoyl-CoA hydratase-related protein [Halalkalicoccus jeotgali]ADJ14941.1 Enoyl-CoA hydratase/isomerase [Halalkalicoccus jeotgali B3]ELY35043.1 Enoyl-CoA hydratase/isomerase [Halalkalicoccus jeotgali B3]